MHAKEKPMIVFHICAIILYNDVGDKSPQPGCLRIVPCYALPQSPNIRISWDIHPTFMLISGRVPRPFTH